jgi:hypothetical protein
MKKMISFTALVMLVASSTIAVAAGRGGGASGISPGSQMRDAGGPSNTTRGASTFTPAQDMKDAGGPSNTTHGASTFSPGHLKGKK